MKLSVKKLWKLFRALRDSVLLELSGLTPEEVTQLLALNKDEQLDLIQAILQYLRTRR